MASDVDANGRGRASAQEGRTRSATRQGTTGTARSRARQVRPAVRKVTKARLALSGASGSGKTFTALSIAQVLAPDGLHTVVDTEPGDGEQGAAELYADLFDFHTIEWDPPFDPRDLALTIRELGRPDPSRATPGVPDVVIVDSASHFWRGDGGTLDIAGGRFSGWKEATPAQNDLVEAILRAPFHVIVCTRAKQGYAVEEGDGGKQKVTKLGMEPIQRDDLEYEFQVAAYIDQQHKIELSKTRCHALAGRSFPANRQGEFAQIYRDWLDSGANLLRVADVAALRQAVKNHPDAEARQRVGAAFKEAFGLAEQIEAGKLEDCWAFLRESLGVPDHAFVAGEDGTCTRCGVLGRALWHVEAKPAEEPAGWDGSGAEVLGWDDPTEAARRHAAVAERRQALPPDAQETLTRFEADLGVPWPMPPQSLDEVENWLDDRERYAEGQSVGGP